MVTSAGSSGTGEVGGVGTVQLVCVCSGLLRMGDESLPLPVWRSEWISYSPGLW